MQLTKTVYEARRIGVPLMYIETTDPEATMRNLRTAKSLNVLDATPEERDTLEAPLVIYDITRGLRGKNEQGVRMLAQLNIKPELTKEAPAALAALSHEQLRSETVAFFLTLSPDTFFKGPATAQWIWNLRDLFKDRGILLIFLGPDPELPPSLANDIMIVHEPRPTRSELEDLVERRYSDWKKYNPGVVDLTEDIKTRAALGLQGLAMFPAENAIAMSLRADGIDFTCLQEQRYALIETDGLKVWKGSERFDDIAGLDGAADLLYGLVTSPKKRAGAVFFVDEIDKDMVGTGGGDRSGMADQYLSMFLKFMEDHKVNGALLLGPPGCGKTELSKALGNEAGLLTMAANLGEAKDHLMGSSERNLKKIFDIILAVSGGTPFMLASCNSPDNIPTSLLRRFRAARIFFDLPNRAAKDKIWAIKFAKYNLDPKQLRPNDDFWTGSDIEICCERAWLRDQSIIEASRSIIPVAKAKPEELQRLREQAHGRYLDAATGEEYSMETLALEKTKQSGRRMLAH